MRPQAKEGLAKVTIGMQLNNLPEALAEAIMFFPYPSLVDGKSVA